MKFKCYHYDIARGAYLKPEVFKEAIKLAADSGFTHFFPYLENMIKLEGIEKACPSCAYTPEQWHEFDEVAEAAGIELIPHFNVIGHSTEICHHYPELAGEVDGFELDVTLPEAKVWLRKCLDEYCSFSKGKHFMIGGDEWQAPNHNLAEPGFAPGKVWAEHINFVADILKENDRVPIVWHDLLLHYPDALDILSREVIIAFWFYDEDSDHPALDMFQQMGFRTIMASGLCNGLLSNRRRRAIECAVRACDKYEPYGLMVTSWTDGRWEKQSLNIDLAGKIINKTTLPEPLLEANSLIELINRNEESSSKLKDELSELLQKDAWNEFPLYKEYVENFLNKANAKELELYEERHFPEGPLYYCIKNKLDHGDSAGALLRDQKTFKVILRDKSMGDEIKVINGDECFLIYPKYGGTLQSFFKADTEIIPHSLPGFIEKNNFLPGGYRSYSGVGGFRPIWAFGSHHNPCILWQGSFEWDIKETKDCIEIFLSREMTHVDVRYKITVNKGQSGFIFEAKATNKIEDAYGTFSFNLPLSVKPERLDEVEIEGESKYLKLADQRDSFLVIPPSDKLTVKINGLTLSIDSNKTKNAGFYTDWSSRFITPDLRGIYQKLKAGEEYVTSWKVSIF
jgi:hypothetical protein